MPSHKVATTPLDGIKVRCENWYWSRRLQILLRDAIGCSWGAGIVTPWNTRRPYLVIVRAPTGRWFFTWCTPEAFAICKHPEWSARQLIAAYPGP